MPKHFEDLGTHVEVDIFTQRPEASPWPADYVEVYVGAGNKLCPDPDSIHSGSSGSID